MVENLTTEIAGKALDATMGKVLNDKIGEVMKNLPYGKITPWTARFPYRTADAAVTLSTYTIPEDGFYTLQGHVYQEGTVNMYCMIRLSFSDGSAPIQHTGGKYESAGVAMALPISLARFFTKGTKITLTYCCGYAASTTDTVLNASIIH